MNSKLKLIVDFEVSHPPCVDQLYNQKIYINYMVRTQIDIFIQNSTFGIQLHVSALYIDHCQVLL
jgi:hypothetical protein